MTAVASTAKTVPTPSRRRAALGGAPRKTSDLPVLIRLPNLDEPTPDADAEIPAESKADGAVAAGADAVTQPAERQDSTTTPAVSKPSAATSKVLALVWKVGIVAAAIGLVVLAYQIINGPPNDDVPPTSDSYKVSDETPSAETATGGHDHDVAISENDTVEEETSLPPTIVTPVGTVEAAQDATSPLAAADDGAAHSHAQGNPADDNPSDEELYYRSGGRNHAAGEQDNWEHARTDDAGQNWEHARTSDTRPWNPTGEQFSGRGREDDYPPRDGAGNYDAQRPWATGEGAYEQTAPNSGNYQDTGSGGNYDYPQTNPQSWRDSGAAHASGSPEQRFSEQGGQYVPPAWRDNGRSASRLHPQIEQPPLRRNDEPNRSGIY